MTESIKDVAEIKVERIQSARHPNASLLVVKANYSASETGGFKHLTSVYLDDDGDLVCLTKSDRNPLFSDIERKHVAKSFVC